MLAVPELLDARVLLVDDEYDNKTAAGRALRQLADELKTQSVEIVVSASSEDARAIIASDASLQAVILDWNLCSNDPAQTTSVLDAVRAQNAAVPMFLLADRGSVSSIPSETMGKIGDFIWLLEDTPEFITGRILAAIRRYRAELLPPMFRALVGFSQVHEYSWHTPGHTGGTAFLKSPVGREFFCVLRREPAAFRPFDLSDRTRLATRAFRRHRGWRALRGAGFRRRSHLLRHQWHLDLQPGRRHGQCDARRRGPLRP